LSIFTKVSKELKLSLNGRHYNEDGRKTLELNTIIKTLTDKDYLNYSLRTGEYLEGLHL
jgi:hypothetical protein